MLSKKIHTEFLIRTVLKSFIMILVMAGVLVGIFFVFNSRMEEGKVASEVETSEVGVTSQSVRIGSVAALDGPAKDLGVSYVQYGLGIAIREFNDNGGAFGRKIEFISRSDGYDPQRTIEETRRLIEEDKVFALAGYVGTPTGAAVISTINANKIPLVGMFTGSLAFREPLQQNIFNIRASYKEETEIAIQYFVDKLKFSKIGVLYQDDEFGLSVLSGIKDSLDKRGISIKTLATYKRNGKVSEDIVRLFQESDVDVIMMAGTYSPLSEFVQTVRKVKPSMYFHTVSFVGPESFASELIRLDEEYQLQESLKKRIFVTQVVPPPYYTDVFDGLSRYHETLHSYYPDAPVTFGGLEGYVAGRVLLMGILDAGKDITREKFVESLEKLSYKDISIGSQITFTKENHQGINKVFMTRLIDGEYMIVPLIDLHSD